MIKAGEFTVLQKAKTALIDNAIYYGTYILIFVILLVYISISTQYNLSFQNLKLIGISAANTWGLFLLGKFSKTTVIIEVGAIKTLKNMLRPVVINTVDAKWHTLIPLVIRWSRFPPMKSGYP